MTEALIEQIGKGAWQRQLSSALNFICAALSAYDAATKGTSPAARLDVERVFAAVELLAERRDLEVTPFVAAWHPAVDEWDQARWGGPSFFDNQLERALAGGHGSAQRIISNLIREVTGTGGQGRTYQELAQRMLGVLRELVAVTPKKVDYLTPLVGQGRRPGGVTVATLNYDLGIEGAADQLGVSVSTGIRSWIDTGRWKWPRSGIRLLKLHGSIDWAWDDLHADGDGDFPRKTIRVTVAEPPKEKGDPALVFGQRGKLRAEGPFLGLLAELEKKLADSRRLIAIGYSFRDDHVNELIARWIAENKERTILVVDPAWPPPPRTYSEDFRHKLTRHLIPPSREPDAFQPRLQVWRTKCGPALDELARLGFDSELPDASADEPPTEEPTN